MKIAKSIFVESFFFCCAKAFLVHYIILLLKNFYSKNLNCKIEKCVKIKIN